MTDAGIYYQGRGGGSGVVRQQHLPCGGYLLGLPLGWALARTLFYALGVATGLGPVWIPAGVGIYHRFPHPSLALHRISLPLASPMHNVFVATRSSPGQKRWEI